MVKYVDPFLPGQPTLAMCYGMTKNAKFIQIGNKHIKLAEIHDRSSINLARMDKIADLCIILKPEIFLIHFEYIKYFLIY